jgi:putative restriction endonuclease
MLILSCIDSEANMDSISKKRVFGHIPGIPPGKMFSSRQELSGAGVHRPTQAGISGSQYEGADSIVLSGGYEDDEDHGDAIIYTGHGGRDETTGQQYADQELTRQNKALAISMQKGLPVRVVRGANHSSPVSPQYGYRYDGLFWIQEYWIEKGKSGYEIIRFRMVSREPSQIPDL